MGDPACWLEQVCPYCGRVLAGEDAAHAPGCAARPDDDDPRDH